MLSFYLIGFKKLFNIGKKIFLVLVVYLVVISLFLHFIAKDKPKTTTDPIKKNREEIYKAINDPQLNKTEKGKLAIAFYRLTMCGLIGEACTDNPDDGDKNFSHSVFGFMTNLLVLPYANPPASGVYWAYSGLQNAGFVPKTYAAEGIGFAAIKPLMNIWKVFRDLSYMLLVLVLIAIGFMIMFRAKINPQTVISVENSLPKIVIALLLITFSFPIAGFLIDLMYITIGIIAVIFSNTTGIGENFNSPTKILNYFYFSRKRIGELFFGAAINLGRLLSVSQSIFNILPLTLQNIIEVVLSLIIKPTHILPMAINFLSRGKIGENAANANNKFIRILLSRIGIIKEDAVNAGSGTDIVSIVIGLFFLVVDFLILTVLAPLIVPFAILIILSLSLVFIFLRIFFMLLYAYIQIILLIVFSPVILAVEMIPGKSTFSSWIKNLLINLATWPILIILLLIARVLLNQNLTEYSNLWAPPFLLYLNPKDFIIIIIIGILFMTPDLIKTIKNLTGIKPLPLDLNLGAFTAGAGAAIGGMMGPLGTFNTLGMVSRYGPFSFLQKIPIFREVKDLGEEATKKNPPQSQPQGP